MRNFKRILALVIAVVMMVGTVATVSAASAWYSGAVIELENRGIATIGANAGKKITRNEFVLWVAKIESRQLIDAAWNDTIADTVFSDVTADHHKAAIAYASRRHFIEGNGDGTFSPDKNVTLAEASAILVRMMGFADRVAFSTGDDWKFNNMQVAQTYFRAYDPTFLEKTGTYNVDYELTYGEAAYLLATILNYLPTSDPSNPIVTASRINLGEALEGITGISVAKSYYVTKMDRAVFHARNDKDNLTVPRNGTSLASLIHLGGAKGTVYTNVIDDAPDAVELTAIDGSEVKVISGSEFTKMLRLSLGLPATPDIANEEADINVYQYCDLGSLISATVKKDTGKVVSVRTNDNSTIVDTYLQATYGATGGTRHYGQGATGFNYTEQMAFPQSEQAKFVGWTIRELKAENTNENVKPSLPLSYNADLATSWTDVKKNASGVVTEATLNFKGVAYKYSDDASKRDIEIVMATTTDADTTPESVLNKTIVDMANILTVDEAVKALINAAQGECFVVFNDVDADGKYDVAVIKESDPFYYVGTPNAAGNNNSTTHNYYSSISNGEIVGTSTMKGWNLGTVIFNNEVHHSAGSGNDSTYWDYRTDGFSLTAKNTGKMQLILRASNKHFFIDGATASYGNATPEHYALVDLATFGVGILDNVNAFAVDGYYKAHITNIDGSEKEVYIPVVPNEKTSFEVAVGGATATYTFDSSAWCEFLADANRAAVIEKGITGDVNDPQVKSVMASWMTGKFVQYALNEKGEVVAIFGTDKAATVDSTVLSGYVLGVTKTETGANSFNVRIAKSGDGVVSAETYYLTATKNRPGYEGQWVLTNPVIALFDWGDLTAARQFNFNTLAWGTIHVFRYATNYYSTYGYNGARSLITNNKYFTSTTDFVPNNDGVHGALNGRGGTGTFNTWTVDADGYVLNEKGVKVAFQKKTVARLGVNGLWEGEVRANASSMFDWDNYAIYNAIFDKKTIMNPTAEADAKAGQTVVKGTDLIYVTVYQDEGSKYLKAGDPTSGTTKMIKTVSTNKVSTSNTDAFYPRTDTPLAVVTGQSYQGSKASTSWMNSKAQINIMNPKVTSETKTASTYTATYDMAYGINPYYLRKYDSSKKTFVYEYRFEKVWVRTGVVGTATAAIDATKTVLIPLELADEKGNTSPLKLTAENKAKYSTSEYYVDNEKSIYKIFDPSDVHYKVDANGNTVYNATTLDYTTGTQTVYTGNDPETNFEFWKDANGNCVVSKAATMSFSAASKTTQGWFPGLYNVSYNGSKLEIPFYAKVVILTPTATGFAVTETTVEEAAKTGIFATSANYVEDNGKATIVTVIGEPAGKFAQTGTATPSVGGDSLVKDGEQLVYLSADSAVASEAKQYGNKWVVVSSGSAYALPTGENVGNIIREYNTYEGKQPTSIDLSIVGGHWYKVDKNNVIISDMTNVVYDTVAVTGDIVEANGWTKTSLKIGAAEEAEDVWTKTVEDVFVGFHKKADGTYEYVKKVVDDSTDPATVTYEVDADANKIGFCYLDYVQTTVAGASANYYTKTVDEKTSYYVVEAGVVYNADVNFRKIELSSNLKGVNTAYVIGATAAGGTTVAFDAEGKKGTDVSNFKFAFFYRNADKTVLYKAGDSTNVTIATQATYDAKIKTEQNAYNVAKADWENAQAKSYLSAARKAYYENNFKNAEAALKAAKDSLLDQFYNGQFWNVPNAPFQKYQALAEGSFQAPNAKLGFKYVVINDVYCVFSDEFIL